MNSMALLCGIDFSGDLGRWGSGCARSNVWVAEGELDAAGQVVLLELRRVQCLPGDGVPFGRLARHIQNGEFSAVAIDAPFSVPAEYVPEGSHENLLRLVANLPRTPDRAPFARGAELVRALLSGSADPRGMKSYRKTGTLLDSARHSGSINSVEWTSRRRAIHGRVPYSARGRGATNMAVVRGL